MVSKLIVFSSVLLAIFLSAPITLNSSPSITKAFGQENNMSVAKDNNMTSQNVTSASASGNVSVGNVSSLSKDSSSVLSPMIKKIPSGQGGVSAVCQSTDGKATCDCGKSGTCRATGSGCFCVQ